MCVFLTVPHEVIKVGLKEDVTGRHSRSALSCLASGFGSTRNFDPRYTKVEATNMEVRFTCSPSSRAECMDAEVEARIRQFDEKAKSHRVDLFPGGERLSQKRRRTV